MRIKKSVLDSVVYTLFCVLTLGGLWLMRIAISQGIRKAVKSDDE